MSLRMKKTSSSFEVVGDDAADCRCFGREPGRIRRATTKTTGSRAVVVSLSGGCLPSVRCMRNVT